VTLPPTTRRMSVYPSVAIAPRAAPAQIDASLVERNRRADAQPPLDSSAVYGHPKCPAFDPALGDDETKPSAILGEARLLELRDFERTQTVHGRKGLAERVGFEPTVGLHLHTRSRRAP
jgi:hypothetical protein